MEQLLERAPALPIGDAEAWGKLFIVVVHPLITAALLIALLSARRRNRTLRERLARIRRAAQIAMRRAGRPRIGSDAEA